MNERPFERHYGELRCRRYLFDPAVEPDPAPRPEGVPPERPAQASPRSSEGRGERPQ
jgi:hypothetical protein